jgi:CRISPR-associated protein Csh2
MSSIIKNNSDFLFLYEAIQCNPNGDPDQENRPRMDTDTDTNLVTDTRIKRYIRDFLKMQGTEIFVDMEGTSKVSSNTKLEAVIKRLLENEAHLVSVLTPEFTTKWADIKKESKAKDVVSIIKFMKDKKNKALCYDLNLFLLAHIVKQQFIDIRLFGSAFAIEGFNRSYIGPVQMNWGYSLHKVKLMESNSIVAIMNDDNSTFGKDYRVHYSLLAFNGTVNRFAAQHTELTETDMELFRNALWQAIPALPTRSKINQYPQLYVELVYNDGYFNGHFGDLRQYVKVASKVKEKEIRNHDDFNLDTSALEKLIQDNQGAGKAIQKAMVRKAANISLSL